MPNKVIRAFYDKTDNRKPYSKGDTYSHSDEGRIAFLIEKGFLTEKSKQPPKEDKSEYPKHVGGGYYELPNGDKVKGKKEAEKAMGDE
ncbi:hypothetical protein Pryu01_03055 [Paraliobacillus ryukyuensis]|uniref:Uncharacterized protein n=1 Tax=Paraliobacillus ryukyuensis TaxID=200904 RepID=A0A366DQB8_9BACI|nr:hypothetical protein [Paraliobacillus ryukyuensis]RBO92286.1 hypothetical protein DES48_11524 [Paraliobacillus ryukyuensis]